MHQSIRLSTSVIYIVKALLYLKRLVLSDGERASQDGEHSGGSPKAYAAEARKRRAFFNTMGQ